MIKLNSIAPRGRQNRGVVGCAFAFAALFSLLAVAGAKAATVARNCFQISVVDDQTGRGVPLVELRLVDQERYYTDSNGIVAIDAPELIGQSIYFHISSPGYEYAKDAFGYRGTVLDVTAGGSAVIKIKRDNIAERLYRVTGAGIYRDSIMTGKPVPLKHPLLDGKVVGQDTVEVTRYAGKLYWFFGDTNRASYPLGQFGTSGATSLLPGGGGLDPAIGVDLTYRTDKSGFSRPMIPLAESPGPVWIGGLFTMQEGGREHLFTHFAEIKGNMAVAKSGLAGFDDSSGTFKPLCYYPVGDLLEPDGQPFHVDEGRSDYVYFNSQDTAGIPLVRCRPTLKEISDSSNYEGFTCLSPGSRFRGPDTLIERSPDGKPVWGWKKNTAPLTYKQMGALISLGKVKADEGIYQLHDIDSDSEVLSGGGSVFWNPFLRRWIMIMTQVYGSPSFLGEVWFAEADTPVGPWIYAKKIASHNHYTFYNPTQHPFFDQDGGRVIFFEGTYTDTFSDVKDVTPRYNYNQLMYRLSLNDRRLALPTPVYVVRRPDGSTYYAQRDRVAAADQWKSIVSIPFYAVPVAKHNSGLVPVFALQNGSLVTDPQQGREAPLFYALPAIAGANEKASPAVVGLYANKDSAGNTIYITNPPASSSQAPVCRVWRNPSSLLLLDRGAIPSR